MSEQLTRTPELSSSLSTEARLERTQLRTYTLRKPLAIRTGAGGRDETLIPETENAAPVVVTVRPVEMRSSGKTYVQFYDADSKLLGAVALETWMSYLEANKEEVPPPKPEPLATPRVITRPDTREVLRPLSNFAELRKAVEDGVALRLNSGTEIRGGAQEALNNPTDIVVDLKQSLIRYQGQYYIWVYEKQANRAQGERIGAVLLDQIHLVETRQITQTTPSLSQWRPVPQVDSIPGLPLPSGSPRAERETEPTEPQRPSLSQWRPVPQVGSIPDLPLPSGSPAIESRETVPTTPEEAPRSTTETSESVSENFEQSFKPDYIVPLEFGLFLKGVGPVTLKEIARSGMTNFFLLHEGNVREITWNGSDYVYAGTSTRASIYNGDMVYESRSRYEADQAMIEQKTLQNEEPKYSDYPLNGLIYMPTLEVNGVTVMRFNPNTRTKYINASIYHSLKALAIEFHKKTKQPLVVSSIYRTHSHQQALFDQYGSERAASPGNSKHNVGIAVDITQASRNHFGDVSAFDTFANQFGFERVNWEEWHFEHIQSKDIRSDSGISRPQISVMLDRIPREGKRQEFIARCINPTLQQAIADGMSAESTSYRNLYHNLYKLLEKPENMQLSVQQFDELCTLERQRQHQLDGRGVLPRIFSRQQRTLAFDTNDIPRSRRDRVIISDNFLAIKHPVRDSEYLRDFIGSGHEVIQIIDNNGRLFDLRWNQAGLGGTGTYEHNGQHFPIDGGETVLLHPTDPNSVPAFSFRDGQMGRREILLGNAEWFEYQINRLNEKWKEWYDDQPLLSRASRFRPLTMYDVCGLLSSESSTRFRHRTGSHSQGEKGMLPLPVNHEHWVGPIGANPLNDKVRTPRVEENILGMLEYMLALKHVSLSYSGGETKYHKIIDRFDNNPKKEAAYVLAVMHARGTNKSVIENIDENECSIGYTFGSRQAHVTAGFEIAEEILQTLGSEENSTSSSTRYVSEDIPSPTPEPISNSREIQPFVETGRALYRHFNSRYASFDNATGTITLKNIKAGRWSGNRWISGTRMDSIYKRNSLRGSSVEFWLYGRGLCYWNGRGFVNDGSLMSSIHNGATLWQSPEHYTAVNGKGLNIYRGGENHSIETREQGLRQD